MLKYIDILYILGFMAFFNMLQYFLCKYFGLSRSLLDVDYLFLFFLIIISNFFLCNFLVMPLLFLFYMVDFFVILLQIFPFIKINDFLYLSSFIFNGPDLYKILTLCFFILYIIYFFVFRDFFLKKIKNVIIMSIFCLLFLGGGVAAQIIFPTNGILGSQLIFLLKNKNNTFNDIWKINPAILQPSLYRSASHPLHLQLRTKHINSNKILYIVNESWGQTTNPNILAEVLAPILKNQQRLEYFEQGSFPFVGATVQGEVRELCEKRPATFNMRLIKSSEFQSCLPQLLKNRGYATSALHGAPGEMYERNTWYSEIGFKNIFFFKDLSLGKNCKSFSGRCDIFLIPTVKRLLLSNKKSFVYWMTLNTHAPYDDYVFVRGFNCNSMEVKPDSESCHNLILQYQFFAALASLLDDPNMHGVEVYVVGDHSPPLFNFNDNLFIFKGNEVAWIHFKIR
ncbi:sulfatase-like hydrolase/transferase [Acinetobacter sp. ANC 4639]